MCECLTMCNPIFDSSFTITFLLLLFFSDTRAKQLLSMLFEYYPYRRKSADDNIPLSDHRSTDVFISICNERVYSILTIIFFF